MKIHKKEQCFHNYSKLTVRHKNNKNFVNVVANTGKRNLMLS